MSFRSRALGILSTTFEYLNSNMVGIVDIKVSAVDTADNAKFFKGYHSDRSNHIYPVSIIRLSGNLPSGRDPVSACSQGESAVYVEESDKSDHQLGYHCIQPTRAIRKLLGCMSLSLLLNTNEAGSPRAALAEGLYEA